jgi:arylformamidase
MLNDPGGEMDLQAEYDNGAKVPGFPAIVARWNTMAAAFRESWPNMELGLAYGPTPRQAMDVFWPGASRQAPMVMFIHGGYWQRMDRTPFSHLAAGLLAQGVAVAIPSYDLCPQVSMAALVEQLRQAAAFLHLRSGRGLLALGHSAGGHLTAMLMATDWASRGLPAIVPAGLPISGLFDLPPLLATNIADPLGLDAAEARRLSPLFMAPPGGRLHAVVGGDEGVEYTRQSRSIAEAWGGSWEALPGLNHFTVVDGLALSDSVLVARAMALMQATALANGGG